MPKKNESKFDRVVTSFKQKYHEAKRKMEEPDSKKALDLAIGAGFGMASADVLGGTGAVSKIKSATEKFASKIRPPKDFKVAAPEAEMGKRAKWAEEAAEQRMRRGVEKGSKAKSAKRAKIREVLEEGDEEMPIKKRISNLRMKDKLNKRQGKYTEED